MNRYHMWQVSAYVIIDRETGLLAMGPTIDLEQVEAKLKNLEEHEKAERERLRQQDQSEGDEDGSDESGQVRVGSSEGGVAGGEGHPRETTTCSGDSVGSDEEGTNADPPGGQHGEVRP